MLHGQAQLAQQAISNSGGFGQDGAISVSWTLGQNSIATLEDTDVDVILTQGFQQADVNTSIPIENFGLKIYPNPVEESLIVQLEENRFELPVQAKLVDATGKVIREFNIIEEVFRVNMKILPDGMYFISLNLERTNITQSILKVSSN